MEASPCHPLAGSSPHGVCPTCRIPLRHHGRRSSASSLWFEPVPLADLAPPARPASAAPPAPPLPRPPADAFDIPAALPVELAALVFRWLLPTGGRGVRALLECGLVCRCWYRRSRDEGVWREACRRLYLTTDLTLAPFLLSPPFPTSYLARQHPDLPLPSLALLQHYSRRPFPHPLAHYAALAPHVRSLLTERDARRIVRARIWAGWTPDACPPTLLDPSPATDPDGPVSPATLHLLHATHPAYLSPLPPFLSPSFPSLWLLSYAAHLRSLSMPFLRRADVSKLQWRFSFRNPVWWRLGEMEGRSWAVFGAEGGYRSGMFEEDVELRWRFLGDDEGEYGEDEAGGGEPRSWLPSFDPAAPAQKRRPGPWGTDHHDPHFARAPGVREPAGFWAGSRAARAVLALGSLLLTGSADPGAERGPRRRWAGRRRRWVQVERYPPLEVSRTTEGGWRMANAYVIFDSVDTSKLLPLPPPPPPPPAPATPPTPSLLQPAPDPLLAADLPPPAIPRPEPKYVFWDADEEGEWHRLERIGRGEEGEAGVGVEA